MTYTNVAAGDPILASTVNDLIKYGPARRVCMLQQQAGQTIASSTDTILTFGAGSEVYDDDNWHNTSSNTSRITPTTAGRYKVTIRGVFAFNITIASCNVYLSKNGTIYDRGGNMKPVNNVTSTTTGTTAGLQYTSNTAVFAGEIVTYVDMNGTTDYLEMGTNQISIAAVSRDTNAAASGRSTFTAELVRSA